MAQQIRVSKLTKDALTATDPNDFILHSAYNSFFILASGVLTSQSVDADPKTFSVAHGLSYTPLVFAFAKYPDGYVSLPWEGQRTSTMLYTRRFLVQVDGTNVYFVFYQGGTGTYSVDIAYYIFNSSL